MVCSHLATLEQELIQSEIAETFRGAAWAHNCREWVYFRCVLDLTTLHQRLNLADCVVEHEHLGTHDGSEAGFVCQRCHDAIMGAHPSRARDWPFFG